MIQRRSSTRTARTVAFISRKPVAPLHIVVVPERHIPNVAHLGIEDGQMLLDVYQQFERWAQEENLRSWRIVTNYGKQAGQRVQHLSFHFLAGRHFDWPPG